MSGVDFTKIDFSSAVPQHPGEAAGVVDGQDRITQAAGKEHPRAGQIRRDFRNQWDHRTQQDCLREGSGTEQQQARRDVRAVGVTDGRDLVRLKTVVTRCSSDEIGQLVGAMNQVLFIEHALGEPPEETWHAILRDLATGTQQVGIRCQRAAELKQIAFIAAGAVQQQHGWGIGNSPIRSGDEPVDEIQGRGIRVHEWAEVEG